MIKIKKGIEEFTIGELADALIIPRRLTKSQEAAAKLELAEARKKRRETFTDNDRLTSRILQLILQLDEYLESESFSPERNFGYFLKEYITIINRKRKVFAQEINVKETVLSQFINHHRIPPENIIIRLEIHSNNNIPAVKWLGLLEKERAHALMTDKELRRQEKANVTHKLEVTI